MGSKRLAREIEIRPTFGCSGLIIAQPRLAERGDVPMARKLWKFALEFFCVFSLHAIGPQAIWAAPEIVPLLANDVRTDGIPSVSRQVIERAAPPAAALLHQIMQRKPRHGDGRKHH